MSEQYIDDATAAALSGTTDPATGTRYPQIGETDWSLREWRRLHHQQAAFGAANALRVYKDGALTFGVRPGSFQDGSNTRTYAGATEQALTDDAANCIYIAADGTLTVSTLGFPDPAVTPHIPLAIIVAAGGDYGLDAIIDQRCRAIFNVLRGA